MEKAPDYIFVMDRDAAIGTDGAQLSWKGLPCPNLCTGGVNFHSVREFIPIPALETMVRILVRIAAAQGSEEA